MITTTHIYKVLLLFFAVSILGVTPKIADNSNYTDGVQKKVDYVQLNHQANAKIDSLQLQIRRNVSQYKK